jgi:hypothetical protein
LNLVLELCKRFCLDIDTVSTDEEKGRKEVFGVLMIEIKHFNESIQQ